MRRAAAGSGAPAASYSDGVARATGAGCTGVLVPVKAFDRSKVRLADAMSPAARRALVERMATHVVEAGAPLPVAVVCDDREVAAWAEQHGAAVVWTPGLGLDGAVRTGVTWFAARGVTRVVVAHADLPLAGPLAWVADDFDGVTLVPDRRHDGTNVAAVPVHAGFGFAYGAGSFHRHRAEARRLGLPLRVVRDEALAWDVDVPGDLLPDMVAT